MDVSADMSRNPRLFVEKLPDVRDAGRLPRMHGAVHEMEVRDPGT